MVNNGTPTSFDRSVKHKKSSCIVNYKLLNIFRYLKFTENALSRSILNKYAAGICRENGICNEVYSHGPPATRELKKNWELK